MNRVVQRVVFSVALLLSFAAHRSVSAADRPAAPGEKARDAQTAAIKQRLADLDRAYADRENQLRAKKTELKQLAESLGVGAGPGGSPKVQVVMEQLSIAHKTLAAFVGEQGRIRTELQIRESALKDDAGFDVSAQELDAMVQSDPEINQAILPVLTQIQRKLLEFDTGLATADAKAEKKLRTGLVVAEQRLETRRQVLKNKRELQKHAAMVAEVKQLKTRAGLLDGMIARARADVDGLTKEVNAQGRTSIDLEMMRIEIETLEQIVRALGMEREKTRLELTVGRL